MTPLEQTTAFLRELSRDMSTRTVDLGTRLGTWLVVGNAAALVIGFNAEVSGTHCDRKLIQETLWWFIWGLGTGFFATAMSYFSSLAGIHVLSNMAGILADLTTFEFHERDHRDRGVPFPNDHPSVGPAATADVRLKVQRSRYGLLIWATTLPIILIYAVSAIFFARGILGPVTRSSASFDSCAQVISQVPPQQPAIQSVTPNLGSSH